MHVALNALGLHLARKLHAGGEWGRRQGRARSAVWWVARSCHVMSRRRRPACPTPAPSTTSMPTASRLHGRRRPKCVIQAHRKPAHRDTHMQPTHPCCTHLERTVHIVLGDAEGDHGGVRVDVQQRLQRGQWSGVGVAGGIINSAAAAAAAAAAASLLGTQGPSMLCWPAAGTAGTGWAGAETWGPGGSLHAACPFPVPTCSGWPSSRARIQSNSSVALGGRRDSERVSER